MGPERRGASGGSRALYDKVPREFQDRVLSVGNTVDPAEAFRAFPPR